MGQAIAGKLGGNQMFAKKQVPKVEEEDYDDEDDKSDDDKKFFKPTTKTLA